MSETAHLAPDEPDGEPSALDLLFDGAADPVATPQPTAATTAPSLPEHPDA